MSTIEVGEKIVLSERLQGIISRVSPETEVRFLYSTRYSFPIGMAEYKGIDVILQDGTTLTVLHLQLK
jgi:hypothetical protein